MFDVFYLGQKPNQFPHEQQVNSLEQAQQRSRTRYCWVITYLVDYTGFDFLWEPVPWESQFRHAWPSQHCADSETYLLPSGGWTGTRYHSGPTLTRIADRGPWHVPDNIDASTFDFSWHPDPTEPPYVYDFGTQWQKSGGPKYTVPGAVDVKYVDQPRARSLPTIDPWHVPDNIDASTFDFSWHPDPTEPPYVYDFGTQWQKSGGPRYCVPGAVDVKYVSVQRAVALPTDQNWIIPDNIDASTFDFSWHPDPTEPPYVYDFGTQWQKSGGPKYTVPGAVDVKYVDQPRARSLPTIDPWHIPDWIDPNSVDYTWHPDPSDPPCNYHFETKWHWNRIGGPEYRMSDATEIKYLDLFVADTCSDRTRWYIPEWIDPDSIDYTWVPCPADPPYIYEFPVEWGWDHVGGPEYHVQGAVERKYVDYFVARTLPDSTRFRVNANIERNSAVLRWRPNPAEPPYIYVFGNQWYPAEIMPTVEYHVDGAVERKYMREPCATLAQQHGNHWNILQDCVWDYSWVPDPGDPPYVYVFGNQWYPAETMPTVEYRVLGATERKYMTEPRATLPDSDEHWAPVADPEFEFDRSWCPDPGDPPYVYVFGNQWHAAEVMPTIEYHVPGATERKFMDHPRACLLSDPEPWSVPEELDPDNIDFSWCPDPGSPPFVYHFGTDYQATVGLTYTVPGATALKFAGEVPRIKQAQPVVTVLEIFYLDHSNAASAARFDALQQRYPTVQRVRYVGSILDTVRRCAARATGSKFWVISSRNDYTDFDFAWHAQPWQASMTHVFGTQWNKWSDTFLINRWEFERHSRWASGIEQFPNLNFVSDQQVVSPQDATDIFVIDHGDSATVNYLSGRYRVVRSVRYFDNYLDTLARVVADCGSEYAWVVSGLCDYTWFDFSWQPEAWQRDMLHVFPSNEQRFGDTFYVPVQRFREQIDRLERLDCFETVNFCADQSVPRWPMPVIQHDQDSHVDAVLQYDRADPVAIFTGRPIDPRKVPTISMWDERARTIVPLDSGASTVIVPKSAIPRIRTQLYDYPYIDKTHRGLFASEPLDIVFISNGESTAAAAFEALEKSTVGRSNRIHRVDGVTGRVAAYHAAARASTTPWFFAVFAKLFVNSQFDWSWQPDRMQQAKHYIFHAQNPVNGLEYGHQAMIAYNRDLTLANPGHGLDFTLDDAHEVVPVLSGVALYADTPWMAWRTAFREVIKLRASLPDVENEFRLSRWLAASQVRNGDWSQWGAKDAVEYYDTVSGDPEQLRLSYEWAWLATYALMKRKFVPDP